MWYVHCIDIVDLEPFIKHQRHDTCEQEVLMETSDSKY